MYLVKDLYNNITEWKPSQWGWNAIKKHKTCATFQQSSSSLYADAESWKIIL